mgnify:CR=1 FL=1
MYLISGSVEHSFIIPELFSLLVKRDKSAAAKIARHYLRAIQDCHIAKQDSELRSAKSIRIDLILELYDAIEKTAPKHSYFASIESDGQTHWAFFRDSVSSQSS